MTNSALSIINPFRPLVNETSLKPDVPKILARVSLCALGIFLGIRSYMPPNMLDFRAMIGCATVAFLLFWKYLELEEPPNHWPFNYFLILAQKGINYVMQCLQLPKILSLLKNFLVNVQTRRFFVAPPLSPI